MAQNPLRSLSISPDLLTESATKRLHPPAFKPYPLILSKSHPTLPLSNHSYNQCVFWSNSPFCTATSSAYPTARVQSIVDADSAHPLSDEEEISLALALASRTLVTEHGTGKVISRSFSKFFNYHEKLAYQPTGDEFAYEIEEKVDGSLISLFWYNYKNAAAGLGEWILASRSSFSNTHTESAERILKSRYPTVLHRTQSPLDKTKTYVFELIDPRLPIKVKYDSPADLILLAIFSRDGSEASWSAVDARFQKLPFRRPRVWTVEDLLAGGMTKGDARPKLDPKQLSKLNRANEEGFVVKFWRTQDDMYPQRIKVKLDVYLKSTQSRGQSEGDGSTNIADSLAKISLKQSSKSTKVPLSKTTVALVTPPSPATLLALYTTQRLSIPSFKQSTIEAYMAPLRSSLLEALQSLNVTDDYGGDAWLLKVTKVWDRIRALSSLHEEVFMDTVRVLDGEAFRPVSGTDITNMGFSSNSNSNSKGKKASPPKTKSAFQTRISKSDVDKTLIEPLMAWFEGKGVNEVVKKVVHSLDVPEDLKSMDVIMID